MKKCTRKFLNSFIIAVMLFVAFGVNDGKAQDLHFSQFYMSPLTLNPATAGAFKDVDATMSYRNQWSSVTSPYKTFAAAIDLRAFQKKWKNAFLGLGLNIYDDVAGDGSLSTLMLDLDLAGHVRVGEHQIVSAGLQGGFGQQSVQTSNLTWDNQFNGFNYVPGSSSGEHFANSAFTYPDIGAGVLYQYNKGEAYISGNNNLHAEAGFSLSHINQPLLTFYESNQSTNYLYMKYTVHGNMTFGLKNTPISLMPGFVFYRQGPNQELMVGSLVKYTLKEDSKYTGYVRGASIALGAYYRWDDAVIITSLFELANYAIGFSYDVNVSDLRAASNGFGGFEIALRYVNPSNFLYQNRARF